VSWTESVTVEWPLVRKVPMRYCAPRLHILWHMSHMDNRLALQVAGIPQSARARVAVRSSTNGAKPEGSFDAQEYGVPTYLQSTVATELCDDWAEAIDQAEAASAWSKRNKAPESRAAKLWNRIRNEVSHEIDKEPVLSSFLFTSILSHSTFAEALAFILSNRISDQTLLPTQLFSLFTSLIHKQPHLLDCAVADLEAVYDRVR
jgi:Serine acetyltransferase, N-terminal